MTKKSWLLAAGCLPLLLSACKAAPVRIDGAGSGTQKIQHQHPDKRAVTYFHGNAAKIDVTVTVSPTGECQVSVEPFVFVMQRDYGKGRGLTVEWQLHDPGHTGAKFRDGGIVFDKPDGQLEFTSPQAADDHIALRNGGDQGFYPYSVLVEAGGKPCDPLDPTGVNDI